MDSSIAQEDTFKLAGASTSRSVHGRIARLIGKTIFIALLVLIALVAVPYGTVEPWWRALFECAVFGLAALWIIEGWLSGSWHFSAYRILLPLVALAAFGLLQTIPTGSGGDMSLRAGRGVWQALSADPHGTQRWAVKMFALILVGAMLLRYTASEYRLRSLIHLIIGIAVASAMFGLLRQMTQHEEGFVLQYLKPGFGYGQFINSNHFAFLLEMAIGLLLGFAIGGGVRRDRLLLYLSVALMLGMTLVSSKSRGGILSMLCQLIIAALLFSTMRPALGFFAPVSGAIEWTQRAGRSLMIRTLLIVCLISTAGIGIVWVGGDPLLGRLEAIQGEVSAQGDSWRWAVRRRDIWPATWQLIKDHPVTGVGMGAYWIAVTRYHDASGEFTPQEAHNDYLELWASGGLIGVVLGAWFGYELIRGVRERLRSSGTFRRAACLGALVGISGIAIHSFFDFGLHITINALVFIALLVIAVAGVHTEEQGESVAQR